MKVIVTGWQGFIGSNFIRYLLKNTNWDIVGVDCGTYAARPLWAMELIVENKEYNSRFKEIDACGDIRDWADMDEVMRINKPSAVFHFAAESHVCRSIEGPDKFVDTNINGTFNLLEAMRAHCPYATFHQISTDEVYGECEPGEFFKETTLYKPRSPYAASKAAADHLVMSYHHTYKFDTRITNCSNNFGPNQHAEKLIPKTIMSILKGEPVVIYGEGTQVRDWIWVEDHCQGILKAFTLGQSGSQYLFGGNIQLTNLEVVEQVHNAIRQIRPDIGDLNIEKINARPTDDMRYAIDFSKASRELGWHPRSSQLLDRLKETVHWYIENEL